MYLPIWNNEEWLCPIEKKEESNLHECRLHIFWALIVNPVDFNKLIYVQIVQEGRVACGLIKSVNYAKIYIYDIIMLLLCISLLFYVSK